MTQRLCCRRHLPRSHPLPPHLSGRGIQQALQDHGQVMRNVRAGRASHKCIKAKSVKFNASCSHFAVIAGVEHGEAISIHSCSSMKCVTKFGPFEGTGSKVTWAEQGTNGWLTIWRTDDERALYLGDLVHIPQTMCRSPLRALQRISFPRSSEPECRCMWPSPNLSKLLLEGRGLHAHCVLSARLACMLKVTQRKCRIWRCLRW